MQVVTVRFQLEYYLVCAVDLHYHYGRGIIDSNSNETLHVEAIDAMAHAHNLLYKKK